MDYFKKCGFLVTSCFLLITLLGDPAEACVCQYSHPQDHYCEADFVIRAKFMGKSQESEFMSRYEIETTKVYKGPEAMLEIRSLYTPTSGSMCGYELDEPFGKQEYVITGYINSNSASANLCNFIEPWAQLSPQQQSGISWNYNKGCSCTIEGCHGTFCPLKTNSQCKWDLEFQFWNHKKNIVLENMICLPKSETSASCSWQSPNIWKSEGLDFLET